jgi:hypothetical protein
MRLLKVSMIQFDATNIVLLSQNSKAILTPHKKLIEDLQEDGDL